MSKYQTRVNKVEISGEVYIGLEIPPELLDDLELHEKEILEWEVSHDKKTITVKRLNVILPD